MIFSLKLVVMNIRLEVKGSIFLIGYSVMVN